MLNAVEGIRLWAALYRIKRTKLIPISAEENARMINGIRRPLMTLFLAPIGSNELLKETRLILKELSSTEMAITIRNCFQCLHKCRLNYPFHNFATMRWRDWGYLRTFITSRLSKSSLKVKINTNSNRMRANTSSSYLLMCFGNANTSRIKFYWK